MDNESLEWPVETSGYEVVMSDSYLRFESGIQVDLSELRKTLGEMRHTEGVPDKPKTKKLACLIAIDSRWRYMKIPNNNGVLPSSDMAEHFHSYDPMQKRSLFRLFSKLRETPESVIKFANKHGLLGITKNEIEPLDDWYSEIRDLRRHVAMYDMAHSTAASKVEKLTAFVPWIEGDCLYKPAPYRKDSLRKTDVWRKFRQRIFAGRTVDAALHEVVKHVNHKLERQVFARLVCRPFSGVVDGLVFIPRSLLAAMWLQFAMQLADMRLRKICQNCGRPFWAARRDAMYCPGGTCKVAAFRKRRRRNTSEDSQ